MGLESMPRRRVFYYVRVSILTGALFVTLGWAWHDRHARQERTAWSRPLHVALVIVRQGPVDAGALHALFEQSHALELRLAEQYARYRHDLALPIEILPYGPVDAPGPPPNDPGNGLVDLARHSYALWRWTSRIDSDGGVPSRGFDSRIYLVARPPAGSEQRWVEGLSEEGGRVGVAQVELDESSVDFGLFVATHELFHTLGASDKYDPSGRTLIPSGLAEPARSPLYPQRWAEVMARNRVISPSEELPPESLQELGVGPETASEIHWSDSR